MVQPVVYGLIDFPENKRDLIWNMEDLFSVLCRHPVSRLNQIKHTRNKNNNNWIFSIWMITIVS